jgi:hypothetical protein
MYEEICTMNDGKIANLERDIAAMKEVIAELES